MKKHSFSKLAAITPDTLIVGVDIAKNTTGPDSPTTGVFP